MSDMGTTHVVSSAGEDYVTGSLGMIHGQNMPDGFRNALLCDKIREMNLLP